MLRICDHPDCTTLTLGSFCVTHDTPLAAERYPRGRPFPRPKPLALEAASVPVEQDPAESTPVRAVSFGGAS
jgi:hypothetical protein